MDIRKITALCAALVMTAAAAGCGAGSDSSGEGNTAADESFEATENIEVEVTDKVEAIPEGAESTLVYLGVSDLNPSRANPEKSTELTMFEEKGGKIEWQQTSYFERFDKLATALLSKQDIPDMTNYEWLSFPAHVCQDMHQPVDPIVDFTDPLWADVAEDAEQYSLNGKHFVAPLRYEASSMMCYNHEHIENEGLDDPYEMYLEGEWNWDSWQQVMKDYVDGGEDRYGINGFFRQHITQQTGKTLVNYDKEKNEFSSNLNDPDIEAAQKMLYDLQKSGIILNGWIGSARDAFNQGCLFYAMGDWGYSGNNSPTADDDWRIVPMPEYTKNPQKITTSDMKAFMWVRGSEKNEAMKCWLDCCRVTYTDPEYQETNKLKFMENNPNWTDEMYQVKLDAVSDDRYMIYDYCFGLSAATGDPNAFDGNSCLTDVLYNHASEEDEEGGQSTWAQVREKYSATIDSEIKEVNQKVKEVQ